MGPFLSSNFSKSDNNKIDKRKAQLLRGSRERGRQEKDRHEAMLVNHESAVRLSFYDKFEAKRVMKRNARAGEYTLAELDPLIVRILHFR